MLEDKNNATHIKFVPFRCTNCNGWGTVTYQKIKCHTCGGSGTLIINQETGEIHKPKEESK